MQEATHWNRFSFPQGASVMISAQEWCCKICFYLSTTRQPTFCIQFSFEILAWGKPLSQNMLQSEHLPTFLVHISIRWQVGSRNLVHYIIFHIACCIVSYKPYDWFLVWDVMTFSATQRWYKYLLRGYIITSSIKTQSVLYNELHTHISVWYWH